MELNTENLIKFFKARLEDAKSIDPVADEKKMERWWEKCLFCAEHMGEIYKKKLSGVMFGPQVITYRDDWSLSDYTVYERARVEGFEDAKNKINIVIEDLEVFGYFGNFTLPTNHNAGISISNNNFQQQSNTVKIDISAYDPEVQECIKELVKELKGKKDKSKIKKLLAKLTDVGLDVLKKIFLHSIGM